MLLIENQAKHLKEKTLFLLCHEMTCLNFIVCNQKFMLHIMLLQFFSIQERGIYNGLGIKEITYNIYDICRCG